MFSVSIPLGYSHLPHDAVETGPSSSTEIGRTNYGHGIVDEAMQWNKDREGSSIESGSDSGNAPSMADSSAQSSRGLDASTLYFKKEDVILLVDGQSYPRQVYRGEGLCCGNG